MIGLDRLFRQVTEGIKIERKVDAVLRAFNACTDGIDVPSLIWTNEATYLNYAPYLGKRGPVTFTGTPAEVVSQMRRWQKGLES